MRRAGSAMLIVSTSLYTDEARRRLDLFKAFAHIRAIHRTDEMLQFVPDLIEALEDQTLIQLWDKPDNIIMLSSGLLLNAGDKPWGFMIVTAAGEAAKMLQYITGQNLGENRKRWESWWAARRG